MEKSHKKFMNEAIELSLNNIKKGGGPFGALIVKEGRIISTGVNSVTIHNDPTAHAELNAIRNACATLNTFDLSGCIIYTSCEPCPMCLGAIYWAHIDKVFYGNSNSDARQIGFDDSFIYDELKLPINERKVNFERILPDDALKVFDNWNSMENKTVY